jgi:hypothetical protein
LLPASSAATTAQPCILDRNYRLCGEVGNQFDLLIRERPHLLALCSLEPQQSRALENARDAGFGNSEFGGDMLLRAEGDKIGVSAVIEPMPPIHEFLAKVAEMGDGAAERGQAEAQTKTASTSGQQPFGSFSTAVP